MGKHFKINLLKTLLCTVLLFALFASSFSVFAQEMPEAESGISEAVAGIETTGAPENSPPAAGVSYTIMVQYLFADLSLAAQPYIATVQEGYTLYEEVHSPTVVGYRPDESTIVLDVAAASEDITITVTYVPNADTMYKVEHYLEQPDGSYLLEDVQTLSGATGQTVTAEANSYTGFTVSSLPSGTIAANDSTVLRVEYTRNSYFVYFDTADGTYIEPYAVKFEGELRAMPADPTRAGYTFAGWNSTLPTSMPAHDITLTASWVPVSQTRYTAIYWVEDADSQGYSYVGNVIVEGTTGDDAVPPADEAGLTMPGGNKYYHRNEEKTAAANADVTIKGDGTTVINVYYDRNEYTVVFRTETNHHGKIIDFGPIEFGGKTYADGEFSVTAKFGAYIGDRVPVDGPTGTLEGWVFDSWRVLYPGQSITLAVDTMSWRLADVGEVEPRYIDGTRAVILNHYVQDYDATTYSLHSKIEYDMYWNIGHLYARSISGFSFEYAYSETRGELALEKEDSDPTLPAAWMPGSDEVSYYYTRNRYDVTLHNADQTTMHSSLLFETDIADILANPTRPAGVSEELTFDGWYTDPAFVESTKFTGTTVPAGNLILYANWVKPEFEVTFKPGNGEMNIVEKVLFGDKVAEPTEPTNPGYTFAGWFEPDSNIRFVFSLPVGRNIELQARWVPKGNLSYTVYYNVYDENNILVESLSYAEQVDGHTMGETVTARAALIEHYLPDRISKSLQLKVSGNEIVFNYIPFNNVDYTVRYLENVTENPLLDEVVVNTENAYVTETSAYIAGHSALVGQLTLPLSQHPDDNVMTFYYVRNGATPYTVEHYQESLSGGYTLHETQNLTAAAGANVTAAAIDYTGFTYNEAISSSSGTATSNGSLVLKLYYDRERYTVRFHAGSNGTLQGTVQFDNVPWGASFAGAVTQPTPVASSGYRFTGWSPTLPTTVTGNHSFTAQWQSDSTPPVTSSSSSSSSSSTGGGGTSSSSSSSSTAASQSSSSSSVVVSESTPPPPVEINPDEVPLAVPTITAEWSLLSLLLSITSLLASAVLFVSMLIRQKKRKETEDSENEQTEARPKDTRPNGLVGYILSIASGLLPMLFFLVLDGLNGSIAFVTKWTPVIAALFAANIVLIVVTAVRRRRKATDQEIEE